MTLAIRGVALAVCLAPLALLAARTTFGLEALRPWRDLTCGVPLWIWVDLCPPSRGASVIAGAAAFPPGFLTEAALVCGLAILAAYAYAKPRAWMAWLLAAGWGMLNVLFATLIVMVLPGRREGDPVPPWIDNSMRVVIVLFAAAAAIHIGRLARRSERT